MPSALMHMTDLWASLYSNHPALRTAVAFAHVGGLLAGGGSALAADVAALRAGHMSAERRAASLAGTSATHRMVLAGLASVIVSGILLAAADVETFLHSRVFWMKMALVVVLAANGIAVVSAERSAAGGDRRAWTRLRRVAAASLVLWLLTTLAGSALPNVG